MSASKPWVCFAEMKYCVHTCMSMMFYCSFVAVESAYFAVKPPERVAKVAKVLTTAQSYAQYLIMEKLDNPGSAGIDAIIRCVFAVSAFVIWFHVTAWSPNSFWK
jgi:hypothetical protein